MQPSAQIPNQKATTPFAEVSPMRKTTLSLAAVNVGLMLLAVEELDSASSGTEAGV